MVYNLIILVVLIVPIIIIVSGMKESALPDATFKKALAVTLITVTFILVLDNILGGIMEQELDATIAIMNELSTQAGVAEAIGVSETEISSLFESLVDLFITTFPAYIVIWTLIISFAEYKIIYKIFTRKDKNRGLVKMNYFRDISLSREFFRGVLLILILSFVSSLIIEDVGSMIYTNVSIIIEFIFIILGMSVVAFFLYSKKVPNPLCIIIGLVIFLVIPFGRIILMVLGLGEIIFNIKKRIGEKYGR